MLSVILHGGVLRHFNEFFTMIKSVSSIIVSDRFQLLYAVEKRFNINFDVHHANYFEKRRSLTIIISQLTSKASLSKCLSCRVSSSLRSRSDHSSSRAPRVPLSRSKVVSTAAVLAASESPDDLQKIKQYSTCVNSLNSSLSFDDFFSFVKIHDRYS